MKIPLSWLKEYVPITLPVRELAHRLTMAGNEVGEVETIGGWNSCYVGHVLAVEKHPNADRLRLCTVDIGDEQLQVVCGAPNVAAGQRVPFARVGAHLFNAHSNRYETLQAARIRGVVSEGMICSELELGLGHDHAGIIVLPDDAPIGLPLADYLGDHVLDIEVTPNRGDCLSVLGIAREVAALTSQRVQEPSLDYEEQGDAISNLTSVQVADSDLCPRYTATLITGLQVGPSPRWLQDRLTRAGMRPINNVVDVTNYVMLEYNQPLHAFDCDRLREGRIVVRRARPSETLVSLDGVERKLTDDMLVIADATTPVGLAGVMGGANSEISEGTTTLLLESATFNPANNRRTSTTLGLRTEASIRFEKGLQPALAPMGLRRATQLILQVAGGKAARGIIDVYPGKGQEPPPLILTSARLKKVLGVNIPRQQAERTLTSLGFACQPQGNDDLRVDIPYWRSDIAIEDDLVEEVARIVGYDEVPTTMLSTPIPLQQPQPLRELREKVKDILASLGLQEVINYPTIDAHLLRKAANGAPTPDPLRLANPLNLRSQHLRTSLRPSLLLNLAANQGQQQGPLRLFEAARVYLPRKGDLPDEREMVAAVVAGPHQEGWWRNAEVDGVGFYDGKGLVDALLRRLQVQATYQVCSDPAFIPGRTADIWAGGQVVGQVGELHPSVIRSFGLDFGNVVLFELRLDPLLAASQTSPGVYTAPSRFPAAVRDISVLVDSNIPASRINEAILAHPLAAQVSIFDVYTGSGVPSGKRSLSYRIQLQAADRTLRAEEANQALQEVLRSLEQQVRATLRGQL